MNRSLRRAATLAALLLAAAPAGARADVQANSPQVARDASSDATAAFPTNKQNEPSIAVDPKDERYLIAGSNDEQQQPACGAPTRGPGTPASDCGFFPGVGTDGVYVSANGGASWTNLGLLDDQTSWKGSPYVSDGDPVIVYGPRPDAKGGFSTTATRAYYVGLASYKDGRSPFPDAKAPELIVVSFSDDHGATWSAPVRATTKDNPNTFNDKNSAGVDTTPGSPGYGNLYVGFTSFRSATATGNGNAPTAVARSTDGGRSFGAPQQLSPAQNNAARGGRQGTAITVDHAGDVLVAYEEGGQQVAAVSRDAGRSYAKAIPLGPVTDLQDPIPGANFRTDSFPSIAADVRPGSTTVYASWATRTAAGGRVVIVKSTDAGRSWGAPLTVSTPAEGYAFFNGMSVAPSGRVDLGFQGLKAKDTTHYGTGNAAIDTFFVTKPVGGSYTTPARVSLASSDPAVSAQNNLQRQFWGDYSTMVSGATTAWFISTDARGGVGCPAVDRYQTYLSDNGLAKNEDPDAPNAGSGAPAGSTKPAPPQDCARQFGNTDVYVARVAVP